MTASGFRGWRTFCFRSQGRRTLAADTEDIDAELLNVKSCWGTPYPHRVEEFCVDVRYGFALPANQVMVRFEIRIHAQRPVVRAHLAQDSSFYEGLQVLVNGGQRDGGDFLAHGVVDLLGGIMTGRDRHGVEDDPPLVRCRQVVFPAKLVKLRHLLL